ncbi:hypothetical protein [Streptomyces niveus]|uniref:hypothetical protein n=1 Tax=Streptomyces niveus TaxID=193462 RepID=UPI00341DD3BB
MRRPPRPMMVPATILAGLLAVTGAWVTALCVPRKAVGVRAYVIQLAAQATFLMAVVTTYA